MALGDPKPFQTDKVWGSLPLPVEFDCVTNMGDNHVWRTIKKITMDTGGTLEEWRQCEKCKRVEVV